MLYKNQCTVLAKQLSDRKATYYSTKVRECAGNLNFLHKLTDKLITNQHQQHDTQSCKLDPIPTWLLKECLDELLPLLTSTINNSLLTGVFPEQCKHAIVRPLLKKHNLDPEEL